MTDNKVLKILGINDFRHLTKDKVIIMASILDKMEPEIAKKALEQFPEFTKTMKDMLSEYRNELENGLQSNNESVQRVYDECALITSSLQKLLENENLSFEEKKTVIEKMTEIARMVSQKDTENKQFVIRMTTIVSAVVVITITVAASIIGGNTQIEPNDI